MTSRERAEIVLNHQEADKPLVDFGGTVVSSITATAYKDLRASLNLPAHDAPITDYMMGVVTPARDIQDVFGTDFIRIAPRWSANVDKARRWTDEWGIRRVRVEGQDYYDVIEHPLKDADIDDVINYAWPDPDRIMGYSELYEDARRAYETTDKCIVADLVAPGFFGSGLRMFGYERFMMDLVSGEEIVNIFLERLAAHHEAIYAKYMDIVGKFVQVVTFNDDYGMQDRMMISPELFQKYFKPAIARIVSSVKSGSNAKMFFHSCGAVSPIIDSLLDIGIDILNPIQTLAWGMDPLALKAKYHGKLVLWGGIDEQGMLLANEPDEICYKVPTLVKAMSKGGGYVAAPSHNFQTDIPVENIKALYKSVKEAFV